MNLFQLFQKIVDSKRPLMKLINCGSSCYLDSLLALIVGVPSSVFLDEILMRNVSDVDDLSDSSRVSGVNGKSGKSGMSNADETREIGQLRRYLRMALANCIAHAVLGRGTTTCDKFKIRDLLSLKNKDFRSGNMCDPTDVIELLSDIFPQLKKDVFVFSDKWKREKWSYCLSRWMKYPRFRSTYNHSILIVDTKDYGNYQFMFTESFKCGDYRLLGVIQRVNSNHYISIFVTRDFKWVYYDDSSLNLYRFIEPEEDVVFIPLDRYGNGTTLLIYCHSSAIEWP